MSSSDTLSDVSTAAFTLSHENDLNDCKHALHINKVTQFDPNRRADRLQRVQATSRDPAEVFRSLETQSGAKVETLGKKKERERAAAISRRRASSSHADGTAEYQI